MTSHRPRDTEGWGNGLLGKAGSQFKVSPQKGWPLEKNIFWPHFPSSLRLLAGASHWRNPPASKSKSAHWNSRWDRGEMIVGLQWQAEGTFSLKEGVSIPMTTEAASLRILCLIAPMVLMLPWTLPVHRLWILLAQVHSLDLPHVSYMTMSKLFNLSSSLSIEWE